METPRSNADRFRFGEFDVDVCLRQLCRNGQRIRLQEQPFQVLLSLLDRQGELVTREELRDQIWPKGTFVDFDHGLNTAIKKIRSALSDNANLPRYVETIPRRGYRFLVSVEKISNDSCGGRRALPFSAQDTAEAFQSFGSRYAAITLIGAALIVSSCLLVIRHWAGTHVSSPRGVVVVILPFENLSGDAGQDYLCAGFSEELTTQLGRADPQRLAVVARVTSAVYARSKTIADIGRDLHADFVLQGSVRRDQRRVRVTAQLIRVRNQGNIWANEFDRDLDSVLVVQSEIAAAIAQQVKSVIPSA